MRRPGGPDLRPAARLSRRVGRLAFGMSGALALLLLVALGRPGGGLAQDIDPGELECLALNVYFEAGGEPRVGRLAVAWVTLNRWADERFPDSICAVVKEGGEARYRCQFHWWCDGLSDVPQNPERWAWSEQAARDALTGVRPDPTGGALYFHNGQVRPRWSRRLTATAQIGNHIFYR